MGHRWISLAALTLATFLSLALVCHGSVAHRSPAEASPLAAGFEVFFNDEDESTGSIYRYRPSTGTVDTIYTRSSGRIGSFSTYYYPHKLYYVSGSNAHIYRVNYVSGQWQAEQVIFTHQTYVRDIAFLPDSGGSPQLYFSQASGAGADGWIFKEEYGKAVQVYRVRLSEVGGYWAGDFAFDGSGRLYLSTGNRSPSRLYRVDGGTPEQIYEPPTGSLAGFFGLPGVAYYADGDNTIYRVDVPGGSRTVVHNSSVHTRITDVQTMGTEPATPTPVPTTTATSVPSSRLTVAATTSGGSEIAGVAMLVAVDGQSVQRSTRFYVDVASGKTVTLQAPAWVSLVGIGHHEFVHWRLPGGGTAGDNPLKIALIVDQTVTAVYAMPTPTTSPTAVATSTATPTHTTVPTSTVTPSATTVPQVTGSPTHTGVPSVVPSTSPTTVPTSSATPTVVASAVPSATVTPSNQGWLSGIVILDGRADHSGVSLHVDGALSGWTTGANGTYTIGPLVPGEHRIDVGYGSYLRAGERPFTVGTGQTLTLPSVTLLGGDTNADGRINIVDGAMVSGTFGLGDTDPGFDRRGDINGDDAVDIFDLVMVGNNFGCQLLDEMQRCARWAAP